MGVGLGGWETKYDKVLPPGNESVAMGGAACAMGAHRASAISSLVQNFIDRMEHGI